MPRHQYRLQLHAAELDRFAVADHPIHLHRLEREPVAEGEILQPAAFELRLVARGGEHLRSGQFLQFVQPGGMVVMRLRVEQDLYVAQLEPELFNVRLYQRHRLGKSAVDQDMPFGEVIRNDVISAAPT